MKYTHRISSDQIENIPIIVIEGDMTSDADADVKKVYSELMDQHNIDKIIVNFEKTKYINSSGIATLINIIQNINDKNGKIAFVGMSDHFKKVMDIVGITDFVQIFETNNKAADVIR
ncbi:MAG: anti-sigma factor antagonist [Spirochaetae bacterium HGW-Spirochaetae-1]|jgi:anti-anti-sigma factor|nr:MAG: anti-sigma factor antagonist [Spirochaetae bacterium HGW-Spirochaetae-1]